MEEAFLYLIRACEHMETCRQLLTFTFREGNCGEGEVQGKSQAQKRDYIKPPMAGEPRVFSHFGSPLERESEWKERAQGLVLALGCL